MEKGYLSNDPKKDGYFDKCGGRLTTRHSFGISGGLQGSGRMND